MPYDIKKLKRPRDGIEHLTMELTHQLIEIDAKTKDRVRIRSASTGYFEQYGVVLQSDVGFITNGGNTPNCRSRISAVD